MPARPPEANALVGRWVAALPTDEVAREMDRTGAPYGVVKSMPEAAAHPYFAERGMIAEVPDAGADGGPLRVVNSPLFFSDAGTGPTAPAPLAGQQTRDVLLHLGYADDRVEALLAAGAVFEQAPAS
jgi:succinate--hydroxymethylglutarate CoA-transferase